MSFFTIFFSISIKVSLHINLPSTSAKINLLTNLHPNLNQSHPDHHSKNLNFPRPIFPKHYNIGPFRQASLLIHRI